MHHDRRSYGSLHWTPFTKLCKICDVSFDFVGKLETFESDVHDLGLFLDGISFDDVLARKNGVRKTTDNLAQKYFSQISKELILQLYRAYEGDFRAGGYPYPDDYLAYGKNA